MSLKLLLLGFFISMVTFSQEMINELTKLKRIKLFCENIGSYHYSYRDIPAIFLRLFQGYKAFQKRLTKNMSIFQKLSIILFAALIRFRH